MNDYTRKLLGDIELSYTDDEKVEVLVSPGWGAGWSTWNDDGLKLAVDKRIIDYFKKVGQDTDENIVKAFCESIGYKRVYCGGWDQLVIETVPQGKKFRITEYDGFEELEVYGDKSYEL